MTLPRLYHLSFFMALAAAGNTVQAAPRTFVASTGSDANPCSLSAPCRTFQVAVNAVDAGGEVVAIDSAGYGTITINKSVQVIVPPGVHGGIASSGFTNGVTVNAGVSDVVTLRGLYISRNDTVNSGILLLSGAALVVENCVIEKFSTGFDLQPTNTARVSIRNTVVRNSGFAGIGVFPQGTATLKAVVEDSHLENVQTGVDARDNTNVLVRNTVASGNSFAGFAASSGMAGRPARLTVENSAVTHNATGIRAINGAGVTTVVLSNNLVTDNTTGLTNDGGSAVMESRGNNTVRGNGTNVVGVITTTFGGI